MNAAAMTADYQKVQTGFWGMNVPITDFLIGDSLCDQPYRKQQLSMRTRRDPIQCSPHRQRHWWFVRNSCPPDPAIGDAC